MHLKLREITDSQVDQTVSRVCELLLKFYEKDSYSSAILVRFNSERKKVNMRLKREGSLQINKERVQQRWVTRNLWFRKRTYNEDRWIRMSTSEDSVTERKITEVFLSETDQV